MDRTIAYCTLLPLNYFLNVQYDAQMCIYDARMCEVAVGLKGRMVTPTVSLCNCICKGRLLRQILLSMT